MISIICLVDNCFYDGTSIISFHLRPFEQATKLEIRDEKRGRRK